MTVELARAPTFDSRESCVTIVLQIGKNASRLFTEKCHYFLTILTKSLAILGDTKLMSNAQFEQQICSRSAALHDLRRDFQRVISSARFWSAAALCRFAFAYWQIKGS